MVLEVLALFPRLAPFKVITLDDVWDQWNRSFMFIMTVLFGSIVTIRSYTGSVIECDGFLKVGQDSFFLWVTFDVKFDSSDVVIVFVSMLFYFLFCI